MKREVIIEYDVDHGPIIPVNLSMSVAHNIIGELIRCKDCKYWCTDDGMFKDIDERQWHHCSHIGIDTEEYFFCSEAERKEE